jgi:SNF2 family DNA or RNA helicase
VPYVELNPEASVLRLTTAWNQKDLVRQVPGARWDARDKRWTVPATWASLATLRGVFRDDLTVDEATSSWAWELHRTRVGSALELRDRLEPLDDSSPEYRLVESWVGRDGRPGLYPFQAAGVQFMLRAECGLLGDEMGAGKTPQTLSLIRAHDELDGTGLPALVICPNSVKHHWADETTRWLPGATPYVVDGSAAARRKTLKAALGDPTALVVVNVESVRLFSRLAPYGSVKLARCRECDPRTGQEELSASRCEVHLKELNRFEFRTVVLDEAHRVKDPKAKQTRAVWNVMHASSVRWRWALTGTPIANHPGDLWSIMHAVAPEEYPVRGTYVDRFCLMSWNAFGGMDVVGVRPDTRDELFRILDPRFRRMLKAVVLPQLPPKVREVRYVDMATPQAKAYRELATTLRTRLADGQLLLAANRLVVKTRLMQFAAASVMVEKPDADDVSSWKVSLREPSPKLDALEEIVEELGLGSPDYRGAPALIAAEHLDLIRLIGARLDKLNVRHAEITGEVAPIDRRRALDDLNAGRVRALVFTGKAGGVGLNMSVADTLINVQRSWSLVDERQKEDRNHRVGSEVHDSVRVIDIVTKDTVEEDQVTRLHEKLLRLDEITRDRAALLAAGELSAATIALLDAREALVLSTAVDLDAELNVTT